MTDDVITLYDYRNLSSGAIKGRLGRQRKDGSRGRARMSVEIVSQPITGHFDELALGKGPADAIAQALSKAVEEITEQVSDSTKFTRKYQSAAYRRGESWVKGRFGSRNMTRPLHLRTDDRYFNHSGTFAGGIVATENKTEKSWTVNVPANRLDPRTSRHAGDFRHITENLIRLVPEFGDPRRLAHHPLVKKAIEDSIEDLYISALKLNEKLRAERLRAALSALGLDRIPGVDLVMTFSE